MNKKLAIPTINNSLCQHFGHCEKFAIIDIDDNKITKETYITPPPHEPGVLPGWLASMGVTHIIAGGMGQKALSLFNQQNIQVLTGAEEKPVSVLTNEFLNEMLKTGTNACDH